MHAREVYKTMLKDTITPAMRDRGFRGGSGNYYLDGDSGHTGSVLLSGNPKRSTSETTHFSIHCGVQSRYLKEVNQALGEKPRKPSVWSDHDWFDSVEPEGDRSANYTISVSSDPVVVGEGIVTILDERALPAVRRSLDDAGLRHAVDNCFVGMGRGASRILLDIAQGRLEEARSSISDLVEHRGSSDPGSAFLIERLAAAEAASSSPS
ncbi:hypothetical protein [Nocardioides jensenii]|uniref:hypothetical protein n=1 Tax=Nocardioides jensenii TaxID=1843 RepID=UPI00083697D5|nr:hypothetical protein [Nocardioides jensenii]